MHLPPVSTATVALAFGDVDADGDLDLVLGNDGQRNRLWINRGNGRFVDQTEGRMPAGQDPTQDLEFADIDSDGDLDLVVANDGDPGAAGIDRLLLNDGRGVFADASVRMPTPESAGSRAVAVGDVDGDGDLDVVFGNQGSPGYSSKHDQLYFNDGTGTFVNAGSTRFPAVYGYTTAVLMADLDDDGDLDVVAGENGVTLPDEIFINDGTGTFTATTAFVTPNADDTRALAAADVDGDGDVDLLTGGYGAPLRLKSNLVRQLWTPFLLRTGRSYVLRCYARSGTPSPMAVGYPFVATARASIPLPPLGTLGLNPASLLALPSVAIPALSGQAEVSFTVPALPSLIGVALHAQAVIAPSPGSARLTNVTTDIGLR